MAKFIYRMQSVLDIKQKLEEQAKNEFAKARLQLTLEEDKLQKLKERKDAYVEEGRKLQESGLNVRDILENRDAIENMKRLITAQQRAVEKAEKVLEEAREKLTEAMKESKTHEKLKEKAFESFMKEENARESKEIDELVSYTYGQKRNSGE